MGLPRTQTRSTDASRRSVSAFIHGYRQRNALSRFLAYRREEMTGETRMAEESFLGGSGLCREDEVAWCRVLWWLLRPGSAEELPIEFQRRLFRAVGLDMASAASVDREVVDPHDQNRLDIVLRSGTRVLVIEAKVNSPVDPEQLRRYQQRLLGQHRRNWVHFALLTPSCHPEQVEGLGGWNQLNWPQVAQIAIEVAGPASEMLTGQISQVRWKLVAEDFYGHVKRICR